MAYREITVGWTHPETEEEFRVTGRLYLGSPGRGPSMAHAGGEPAEDPSFDVESVVEDRVGGVERPDLIELVEQDLDNLTDEALEADADAYCAAQEDAADAARDDARMGD
jgi:hypothetical protein